MKIAQKAEISDLDARQQKFIENMKSDMTKLCEKIATGQFAVPKQASATSR